MGNKEWKDPEMKELSLNETEATCPYDLGHGYDDVNHTHSCRCGVSFPTFAELVAHERQFTNEVDENSEKVHQMYCTIIS